MAGGGAGQWGSGAGRTAAAGRLHGRAERATQTQQGGPGAAAGKALYSSGMRTAASRALAPVSPGQPTPPPPAAPGSARRRRWRPRPVLQSGCPPSWAACAAGGGGEEAHTAQCAGVGSWLQRRPDGVLPTAGERRRRRRWGGVPRLGLPAPLAWPLLSPHNSQHPARHLKRPSRRAHLAVGASGLLDALWLRLAACAGVQGRGGAPAAAGQVPEKASGRLGRGWGRGSAPGDAERAGDARKRRY